MNMHPNVFDMHKVETKDMHIKTKFAQAWVQWLQGPKHFYC